MSERPIVEVDGLTIRYGKQTAVEDLSLAVAQGSVYALLGRNGSGKSSTVRCLLGQQKASSGRTRLFGLDSWKKRSRAMLRTGVVPENPDVPPEATAERLRPFMARVTPRWSSAQFLSRLESFGVPSRTRFSRLSKGQQRQFALALALAHSPELLVLDDPTLGLDSVARRRLFEELVGDLAERGTTVFMTTHDLAGVEGIADRVGVVKNGSLLVNESLETLKARFCRLGWAANKDIATVKIEAGLRHLDLIAMSAAGGSTEAVVGGFSEVGFGRFRQEAPVEVMRVESLSLEEIFVALCGENNGGA